MTFVASTNPKVPGGKNLFALRQGRELPPRTLRVGVVDEEGWMVKSDGGVVGSRAVE